MRVCCHLWGLGFKKKNAFHQATLPERLDEITLHESALMPPDLSALLLAKRACISNQPSPSHSLESLRPDKNGGGEKKRYHRKTSNMQL